MIIHGPRAETLHNCVCIVAHKVVALHAQCTVHRSKFTLLKIYHIYSSFALRPSINVNIPHRGVKTFDASTHFTLLSLQCLFLFTPAICQCLLGEQSVQGSCQVHSSL